MEMKIKTKEGELKISNKDDLEKIEVEYGSIVAIDRYTHPIEGFGNVYGRIVSFEPVELRKSDFDYIISETLYSNTYAIPEWDIGMTGEYTISEYFITSDEFEIIVDTLLDPAIFDKDIIHDDYIQEFFDPGSNANFSFPTTTYEERESIEQVLRDMEGCDYAVVVYDPYGVETTAYTIETNEDSIEKIRGEYSIEEKNPVDVLNCLVSKMLDGI